jgi:hypothetical protein
MIDIVERLRNESRSFTMMVLDAAQAADEIETLRQRVKELEDWQQEALAGEPVPLSEWQKMESELATLKQAQGEIAGYVNEEYSINWVKGVCTNVGDPLYTSATTIKAGWIKDVLDYLKNAADFDPTYRPETVPMNRAAELWLSAAPKPGEQE